MAGLALDGAGELDELRAAESADGGVRVELQALARRLDGVGGQAERFLRAEQGCVEAQVRPHVLQLGECVENGVGGGLDQSADQRAAHVPSRGVSTRFARVTADSRRGGRRPSSFHANRSIAKRRPGGSLADRMEPSMSKDDWRSRLPPWVWPAGLATLVLIALWPIALGEFVTWDDYDTIARNPLYDPPTVSSYIKHWTTLDQMHLYIPITYSLWHVLAMFAWQPEPNALGLNLSGQVFSAMNLLMHIGATVLCYLLIRRLLETATELPADRQTRDRTGIALPAALGAAVFAVHPIQVESLGWISGMKDVLSTTLMLLTLWLHLQIRGRAGMRYFRDPRFAAMVICGIAAMLSKPTAVVLPAMIVAIEWICDRCITRRMLLRGAVLVPASIVVALITRTVQNPKFETPVNVDLWQRPIVALDALGWYLSKLFVPMQLAPDYTRPPRAVMASSDVYWTWLLPAAVIVVALLLRKRLPLLLGAAMLAVIPLLPVLGFVSFDFQSYATVSDHYAYPAMIGVALAVGAVCTRLAGARWAIAAAIVVLGVLSFRQSWVWRDAPSLMQHTMQVSPRSWMAPNNLASHIIEIAARDRAGDPAELAEAERLLRHVLTLRPKYPEAFDNLAAIEMVRAERLLDLVRVKQSDDIDAIDRHLRLANEHLNEGRRLGSLSNNGVMSRIRVAEMFAEIEWLRGNRDTSLMLLDQAIKVSRDFLEKKPEHRVVADWLKRLEQTRAAIAGNTGQ